MRDTLSGLKFDMPDVDSVMEETRRAQELIRCAQTVGEACVGDLLTSAGFFTAISVKICKAETLSLMLETAMLNSSLTAGRVVITSIGLTQMSEPRLLSSPHPDPAC